MGADDPLSEPVLDQLQEPGEVDYGILSGFQEVLRRLAIPLLPMKHNGSENSGAVYGIYLPVEVDVNQIAVFDNFPAQHFIVQWFVGTSHDEEAEVHVEVSSLNSSLSDSEGIAQWWRHAQLTFDRYVSRAAARICRPRSVSSEEMAVSIFAYVQRVPFIRYVKFSPPIDSDSVSSWTILSNSSANTISA